VARTAGAATIGTHFSIEKLTRLFLPFDFGHLSHIPVNNYFVLFDLFDFFTITERNPFADLITSFLSFPFLSDSGFPLDFAKTYAAR